MGIFGREPRMPEPAEALPGRAETMPVLGTHSVLGTPTLPPFPEGLEMVDLGMGCFWGAELLFWDSGKVFSTAVGYAAGFTPNPTYEEVCSGLTGHNEVVRVVFDPSKTCFAELLRIFWEGHDPTQGLRQGNDVGTQYRSGIYVSSEAQRQGAEASRDAYQQAIGGAGRRAITTEIVEKSEFYYAEDYHQQYLAKNPGGYCGLGGTGVAFPDIG